MTKYQPLITRNQVATLSDFSNILTADLIKKLQALDTGDITALIPDLDFHTAKDLTELGTLVVNDQEIALVTNPNWGGLFTYFKTTNLVEDGGHVIKDSQGRLWVRLDHSLTTPFWYGAVGDKVTDDTQAITKWFANNGLTLNSDHVVTDASLILKLRVTNGSGSLIYQGVAYPAGNVVNQYLSLKVPSVFPTIYDAVGWLDIKRIIGQAGVDILIADGTYAISKPIKPAWADGPAISIRGNEAKPANVILNVDNTNNNDCFLFSGGVSIGWLNGFRIQGTTGWISLGEWNDQCYGAGVRASGGCNVVCGANIQVDKMYYGMRSMQGSTIHANGTPAGDNIKGGGVVVTNAGDVAFHAYNAALECNCAEAYYTGHNHEGLGFGFCAEAGGMIICEYAKAANNIKAGFYALSNGTAWAHGVDSTLNKYGVLAWGGTVECNTLGKFVSTIYNNTSHGVYSTKKGFVGANSALVSDNQGGGFVADSNATIDITATSATNNALNGYSAEVNGLIEGDAAKSTNNKGNGYNAQTGGVVRGAALSADGNTGTGYYAKTGGRMFVPNLGGANNTVAFANPVQGSTQDTFVVGNMGAFILSVE